MAARARRGRCARRRVRRGAGRRRARDCWPDRPDRPPRDLGPRRSAICPRSASALPKTSFPRAGSLGPAAAVAVRDAADARRRAPARRLHRGEPRLPASVPALSGGADLQRPVPRRAARGRARRHRRAGRRRRRSTSRSAIPISSTARRTRCASSTALHAAHPDVTYDVTIKVEHLLQHRELLPRLRDTGCAFVTSAVESVDDRVLALLDKGHTRAGFRRGGRAVPRARADAGADVRRVSSVADARRLLRSARHDRRRSIWSITWRRFSWRSGCWFRTARGCWSSRRCAQLVGAFDPATLTLPLGASRSARRRAAARRGGARRHAADGGSARAVRRDQRAGARARRRCRAQSTRAGARPRRRCRT